MQIRMKDQLSADEALMLLEVANAEAASLRQQLAEAHQIIQRREAVIAVLERDIHQLELQMEAVGAGGVSGKRITDDGALEALQACEQAYHRMIVDGTPQDCRAHDAARVAFWRVFGGKS